jgi:hypothetical protein
MEDITPDDCEPRSIGSAWPRWIGAASCSRNRKRSKSEFASRCAVARQALARFRDLTRRRLADC